jgi:hypothetical protein
VSSPDSNGKLYLISASYTELNQALDKDHCLFWVFQVDGMKGYRSRLIPVHKNGQIVAYSISGKYSVTSK